MQAEPCKRAPLSPWSLADLLDGWVKVQKGYSNTMITGLDVDSRTIEPGNLFFAVQGTRAHGLQYTQQAVARGAAAVVWETSPGAGNYNLPDTLPFIPIPALQQSIGYIAGRFFQNPSANINVTGVTGTDGKTSVSQFIAQAYEQLEISCGVIGTLGYGVYPDFEPKPHTTPNAICMHRLLHGFVSERIPYVVIEASSHGLKQGRLNGLAVDTAVFTNLGRDHMNYHVTLEDYEDSKRILFQMPGLKNAVINVDDAFGCRLADEASQHLNVVSYSCDKRHTQRGAYVHAEKISCTERSTAVEIVSSWGNAEIETGLCGKFNVSNILAAAGALLADGIAFDEMIQAVSSVRTVPGRMERIPGKQNSPTVLVDYAHTPQALSSVLKTLRETCAGELWCVFGCGGNRDSGKRELMAQAVESIADFAVITDDNPRYEDPDAIVQDVVAGFTTAASYFVIRDREQAILFAINMAKPGDTVLIAGKGHEALQIVRGKRLSFDDRATASRCLQEYPA